MRKYQVTGLLVLVLAVLIGTYFILNYVKPFPSGAEVFRYKEGSITELTISSLDNQIRFCRQGDDWVMKEPAEYAIDQRRLSLLEGILCNLTALRRVENETGDLSGFGLENPVLKIGVQLKNGETKTMLVGSETTSKNAYYAMVAGDQSLYTLYKSDIDVFKGDASDFRDRDFLSVDPLALSVISMIAGVKEEFKLIRGSKGQWRFSFPVSSGVKGDVIQDLLKKIFKIRIQDFIADQPNPSQLELYGLNKPAYTLTIGDKSGKVQTIYFGKEDPLKKVIFLKMQGKSEIVTISSDVFRPGQINMNELFNVAPLSIGIGKVSKITLINHGKEVEFSRDPSKRGDNFRMTGKPINKADFTTLYINIMALSAEGYDSGNKGEAPEFTVIFDLQNQDKVKADFSKRNETSYFITINDKPLPFYVGAYKISLVQKWLDRVCRNRT